MITSKPTISKEVVAMAEALSIIGSDDLLMAANPLTVQLFATTIVWTYRDIWQNYLWDAEDLIYQQEHGYRLKG
tara:strand:+ start:455 stop:676 length:222 start_codon:yes stop_codon:yes gene_type:complete